MILKMVPNKYDKMLGKSFWEAVKAREEAELNYMVFNKK